jgi:putative Holliday junction resolvase
VQEISDIIQREGATRLIVGEPVNIDGSRGPAARRAARFARRLQAKSGLPCTLVDERLSSVEARKKLREAGVNTRRHPERVDAAAAQILLQQYLDEQPEEASTDD